jgi:lysophospholipase L1-like esterase
LILTAAGALAALAGTFATGPAAQARVRPNYGPAVRYVALGDSYAAGQGAGAEISSSGACDRSDNAYPARWAAAHDPAFYRSVACSGATTSTVLATQLSLLGPATTLVSLTAGGNDVHFSDVMTTCVLLSDGDCRDVVSHAEHQMTTVLPGRLDRLLTAIRQHAPNARIVLTGYPRLYDMSRSGSCYGLSGTDRGRLNRGADLLDSVLAAAAARNGDVFADVRAAFGTHAICDGDASWLHAVDLFSLSDSYHPTATGQSGGYLPAFTALAG